MRTSIIVQGMAGNVLKHGAIGDPENSLSYSCQQTAHTNRSSVCLRSSIEGLFGSAFGPDCAFGLQRPVMRRSSTIPCEKDACTSPSRVP